MPKQFVNGIELYYELEGSGPPIVLIPGFTCDHLIWSSVLPELCKHFTVIAIDNRGAGKSDCPDHPYTIEMMAQDTFELIDHLNLEKTHLMGHSMGGCIVQDLAMRHPNRFKSMTLCNSLIKMNSVGLRMQHFFLHLRQAGVSKRLLFEGIMPWIFSNEFLQNNSQVQLAIEGNMQSPNPITNIGFKRQLEALSEFNSTHWFQKINIPTLVINGTEDILCPHQSEKLAKGIINAKLVNFTGSGHAPHLEKPDEFCKTVISFMKSFSYKS